MKLENKVAVVTGAASGMGKAIAELYAKEGAKVLVADFNIEGAEQVVQTIQERGGEATAFKVDVSSKEQVEQMIDQVISEFGKLDILVNNAGIMDKFEPVADVTDESWEKIFSVNTNSVLYGMRKAINYWLEKDMPGVIVNTISTGGLNGAHAGAAYGASKHAVVGLTKNSAFMYAQKNIRINGIAPGAIQTNISNSLTNINEFGISRAGMAHALTPRMGESDEVAAAALFLASDEASFVNGIVMPVDGGWTAAF
ncbi:glucose 1-dehydrogenase [Macrococcus brunensis]|uniref:Diacetyl reductase [(S)-acetoin forming] n=1 Tax=Macrococcus brunensis TaxID=198483 RepID=A0A4R6BE41_9STAP|nr:glucose 1-dehydrogenase [Macrococcus brunensis]TDL98070.1 glucose 1-dehydrogenase [Macrococcus brunensis]